MNLQGQNILIEEKQPPKESKGVSKVKKSLEEAKKIDREIPYASNNREAYSFSS